MITDKVIEQIEWENLKFNTKTKVDNIFSLEDTTTISKEGICKIGKGDIKIEC